MFKFIDSTSSSHTTKLNSSSEVQIKEICNNCIKGKYDALIFNESPTLTDELKILISTSNRMFIQYLFTKCTSRKALDFWLNLGEVKLPKDAWALAVNLGNNIYVLQYFKDIGMFNNLSKDDKELLLARAQRFKGAGLEFLKVEFSKLSNNSIKRKL